ncbi:MAG: 30S ribosomal protein S12 methylthiotransferase RimO [Ruminococcaceae bacterium]|nr:30S ribosomal protein S12 methylthiotransferase RimO [Oscillospiraceae bacterium]
MKKVSLVSLGCSKNLVDAEEMLGLLEDNGFEIAENEEDADVMIVNTCAFIDSAKQESIDCILELAKYKEKNPDRLLVVTGCMSQRYKEELKKEIPEVDIVIGTNEYGKIAEILKSYKSGIYCSDEYMDARLRRVVTTPPYMAYLKIAEGCDNHCTYCVIPSIRGKYRSRSIEDIIDEAKELVAGGAKELVVIAQDTTRYGIDRYGEYKLPELLKKLCLIDDVRWIRVHYCYPELITDELIETFATEEKICNYLDIPIQHCNDEILRLMGRRTNKNEICNLIRKLREKIPGVVLRTSLIAGFPGETEEQFEELRDFVTEAEFDRLGVFAYSQEEGTPAAKLKGQLDEEEKLARQEMLMVDQAAVSEELNRKKIGKTFDVLTEGYDAIVKMYYGRTYGDSEDIDGKVFFTSKAKLNPGEFVTVEITDYTEYDLYGLREEK